jgi:hypothetical protein
MSLDRLRLINRCIGIIIVMMYLALAYFGVHDWLLSPSAAQLTGWRNAAPQQGVLF